jgi:hypothetical protein
MFYILSDSSLCTTTFHWSQLPLNWQSNNLWSSLCAVSSGTSSPLHPNIPINKFSRTLCIKISLLYTNLSSTYMHEEVAQAILPEHSTRTMSDLLPHKYSLDIIAWQFRPVMIVSKKLQKYCITVGLYLQSHTLSMTFNQYLSPAAQLKQDLKTDELPCSWLNSTLINMQGSRNMPSHSSKSGNTNHMILWCKLLAKCIKFSFCG